MDMENRYGSGYGYGYGLTIKWINVCNNIPINSFFWEIKYIASHYLTRLNLGSIIFK